MNLTTKTHEELQALLAAARESTDAIVAEQKRRADEEAEKARKRVRPYAIGKDNIRNCCFHTKKPNGIRSYFESEREARVHAYAECMAKVAEDFFQRHGGYIWGNALAWCADMIAERPTTPQREEAARKAGFID